MLERRMRLGALPFLLVVALALVGAGPSELEEISTEATDLPPPPSESAREEWVSGASAGVLRVGDRVRRGPDWKWNEQDGGEGQLGTVAFPGSATEWARVEWDGGKANTYRWGIDGKYDLEMRKGPSRGAVTAVASPSLHGPLNVVERIRGMGSTPGDRSWDDSIAAILIAAYDMDHSGTIDQSREVAEIPCEVFRVLELEFDKSPTYSSTMRAVYGFPSNLGWVGGAIGFHEGVRGDANLRWEGCTPGMETGAPDAVFGAADGLTAGLRVTRGPDWKWEVQDGGPGQLGTVVGAPSDATWARVRWDIGSVDVYRWGHEGKKDLTIAVGKRPAGSDVPELLKAVDKLPGSVEWDQTVGALLVAAYDTSSNGVIDSSRELRAISCDVFETLESEFEGAANYSEPMRIIYGFKAGYSWVGGAVGFAKEVRAPVDAEWLRCTGKDAVIRSNVDGMPVGTRVRRGPDWKWDDQDGGAGKLGTVVRAPTADEWVKVEWDAGGSNTYRWGHLDSQDIEIVSGSAVAPAGPEGDLVRAILESSWTGMSGSAREQILPLLVSAYDTDMSGTVDTDAEVARISCTVMVAVKDRYEESGAYTGPLRAVFGFEEGYGWVGGSLGFDESVREQASAKMLACGLE